jgi:conjugal transfer mating pair stabilization protein TraN
LFPREARGLPQNILVVMRLKHVLVRELRLWMDFLCIVIAGVEKDGLETLVCKGVPCIDGNCVDKRYMTNGEMMDSISKLYATSKMNPDKNGNFSLFQGSAAHCSKKATSYSNCCRKDPKGWGKQLGAKCTKDENDLAERRANNLCVYVGQSSSKTLE